MEIKETSENNFIDDDEAMCLTCDWSGLEIDLWKDDEFYDEDDEMFVCPKCHSDRIKKLIKK